MIALKKFLKGALYSLIKWRYNRVKVDKVLSILAILQNEYLHMVLDSGSEETGWKPFDLCLEKVDAKRRGQQI